MVSMCVSSHSSIMYCRKIKSSPVFRPCPCYYHYLNATTRALALCSTSSPHFDITIKVKRWSHHSAKWRVCSTLSSADISHETMTRCITGFGAVWYGTKCSSGELIPLKYCARPPLISLGPSRESPLCTCVYGSGLLFEARCSECEER